MDCLNYFNFVFSLINYDFSNVGQIITTIFGLNYD